MLGDAIQSVLAQTCADWELVVVDDGSTDDTRRLMGGFGDPRIHYVYEDNKGLPGARNTGIRAAQGNYIAFLDSDDLFLAHKLQAQLEVLQERPNLGLLAAGYQEVDRDLRFLREVKPWQQNSHLETSDWLCHCPFVPNSVVVRREWLERVGLFDEEMRYVEDWDLWLRLSHAGCRMGWLRQSVCLYRIHGQNMVRDVHQMKLGMVHMLDKFYARLDVSEPLKRLRSRAYGNIYLNIAARALAGGLGSEAAASLAQAVAADPSLAGSDPPRFLQSLASFALSSWVVDAKAFMREAVNLLAVAGLPAYSVREAHALLAATTAFDRYQQGEYGKVPGHVLLALARDSHWWRNRGLLSVGVRSAAYALCPPRRKGVG